MKNLILTIKIFSVITYAFAADFDLSTPFRYIQEGDIIKVTLKVTNNTSPYNAVTGKLSYDTSVLSLLGVDTKNTVIEVWPTGPQVDKTSGEVYFESGVIDKSVIASESEIIAYAFLVKRSATTTLSLSRTHVYKDDGLATDLHRQSLPLVLYGRNDGLPDAASTTDKIKKLPTGLTIDKTQSESDSKTGKLATEYQGQYKSSSANQSPDMPDLTLNRDSDPSSDSDAIKHPDLIKCEDLRITTSYIFPFFYQQTVSSSVDGKVTLKDELKTSSSTLSLAANNQTKVGSMNNGITQIVCQGGVITMYLYNWYLPLAIALTIIIITAIYFIFKKLYAARNIPEK